MSFLPLDGLVLGNYPHCTCSPLPSRFLVRTRGTILRLNEVFVYFVLIMNAPLAHSFMIFCRNAFSTPEVLPEVASLLGSRSRGLSLQPSTADIRRSSIGLHSRYLLSLDHQRDRLSSRIVAPK